METNKCPTRSPWPRPSQAWDVLLGQDAGVIAAHLGPAARADVRVAFPVYRPAAFATVTGL